MFARTLALSLVLLFARSAQAAEPPVHLAVPAPCLLAWHRLAIRQDFEWTRLYEWAHTLATTHTLTVEGCTIATQSPADVIVPTEILVPDLERLVGLAQLPRMVEDTADTIWRVGCATVVLPGWPPIEVCQTP